MEIIPNGQFLPPKLFAQILLVMRLTILFLTLGFLHVSAKSFSQEKITLNVKNVTLDEVFKEVTRQSGYYFWSGSNMPELATKVDVEIKNGSIQEVLGQCLKGLPLTFTISDKIVFVKEVSVSKQETELALAKGIDVKGKVTDENGVPLAGATIAIQSTKIITVTNDKGEFALRDVDPNATIVVSNIGYESQSTHFGGRGSFNFSLKQKVGILDETQVIAYGTTTQRYSVGSISKVSSEDIAEQPVTNVLGALEGRVPGLVVTQSSGVPGAGFSVQIRGNNSIALSGVLPNSPLFIIDGVPFAPQNVNINQFNSLANSIGSSTNGISPFNSIDPNDIESIEVLKDAEATSIYGSRGANGVVLITTKKGKIGKTAFTASVNTGGSEVTRPMQMMNTMQYLAMRHQALNNDGVTPSISNGDFDLLLFDTTTYTNWEKKFIGGTAHATNMNMTLSGGNQNTQFLFGGGYHHENYIVPGDFSDDRISVNTSFHHTSTDQRLSADFFANYTYDENNSSGQPDALFAFTLPPNFPALIDGQGNLVWNYNGVDLGQYTISGNPLAYLKQNYSLKNYNLVSNFQIGYKIIPGLTVKSSFGYNTFNSHEYSGLPLGSQDPSLYPQSSANFGTNDFETWIIEPQAEYRKTILGGKLDLLIGETFQKSFNSQTDVSGSNYSDDALLGSISAAGITSATDNYAEDKYNAAFGRLNYLWHQKYILSLSTRKDGSSRFGPGKQFGTFASAGFGWIFSEESLIRKNIGFLSFGKLRASYGSSGNDNIGDYKYQANWSPQPTNIPYQNVRGFSPENLANPSYSWALNKKLDLGLDLGFFHDRILANVDWFRNRCGNQLINYALPNQTGFSTVVENWPAVVQNTGLELQIASTNIKSKNFFWSTGLNMSIPENKLISFPNIATSSYASRYIIGQSLSIKEGYKYIGVNDTTGVFEFQSGKGVPTYTPVAGIGKDYYKIGNLDQKFNGGFRNTFGYRGFQLDIFAQFVRQIGQNYLQNIYTQAVPGFPGNNAPLEFLGAWKKPGDKTSMQQLTESSGSNAYNAINYIIYSSGAYTNASYIRFKTISVSYNLSNNYLKKLKVNSIRIYFNAQNLFTITTYKGDPESQNYYGIPPLKTLVGGMQFNF